MANGQFETADVLGDFNRGQQFKQQRALEPIKLDQAAQNLQFGRDRNEQSLRAGELGIQNTQGIIDQRNNDQKNQSLFNTALRIQSASDDQIIPILEENIARVISLGGDPKESIAALKLARSGDMPTVRSGADNLIKIGERQGNIKAPIGSNIKPTSSAQDFNTFKQLNARALKTGDPVDIELAEKFGVQSGFDRLSEQEKADIDVDKESRKTLSKQAATASKESFDSLKGVRTTIANIDDAIKVLDKDEFDTGPIISKLPSFRQAAIELDNIKGRMGLDVVGATTFGALSESELAFALDVALPDSLEPKALREWLVKKRDSQTKLANELRKAASFLGTPGNTIAGYLAKQEKDNPSVGNLSDDELFK